MDSKLIPILGVIMLLSLIVAFIERRSPEFAPAVALAGSAAVFCAITGYAVPLIEEGMRLANSIGFTGFDILLKAVGIAALTQLCCELLRDSGHGAAAFKADMVGRAAILFAAAPLIKNVLELARELLD